MPVCYPQYKANTERYLTLRCDLDWRISHLKQAAQLIRQTCARIPFFQFDWRAFSQGA